MEKLFEHPVFKKPLFWHVCFWLIYLFSRVVIVQFYAGTFWFRLGIDLFELPLKMGAVYALVYFIIPHYILRKKYVKFFFALLTATCLVVLVRRIMDYYVVFPLVYPEAVEAGMVHFWDVRNAFRQLIFVYPVVGFGTALNFTVGWFKNRELNQQLMQEKLQAELRFLKSQVHPHFLFNTLNNLYSLTLDQSPKAPDVVLKLSGLLSYMLYECNAQQVPVKKEIEQLESYMALEKIRYGERIQITCDISGDLQQGNIAPLLLVPFIENSFKHGVSGETGLGWINLFIQVKSGILTMQLENSKVDNYTNEEDKQGGLGLQNVKRRLELLYEDKYDLKIYDRETYLICLKLHLNGSFDLHDALKMNEQQPKKVSI